MEHTTCCWSMQIEEPWKTNFNTVQPPSSGEDIIKFWREIFEIWELWSPYIVCSRATTQRHPTRPYFKGTQAPPYCMEILLIFLGGIKMSNLTTSS